MHGRLRQPRDADEERLACRESRAQLVRGRVGARGRVGGRGRVGARGRVRGRVRVRVRVGVRG